jgi:hypothetical protein
MSSIKKEDIIAYTLNGEDICNDCISEDEDRNAIYKDIILKGEDGRIQNLLRPLQKKNSLATERGEVPTRRRVMRPRGAGFHEARRRKLLRL